MGGNYAMGLATEQGREINAYNGGEAWSDLGRKAAKTGPVVAAQSKRNEGEIYRDRQSAKNTTEHPDCRQNTTW